MGQKHYRLFSIIFGKPRGAYEEIDQFLSTGVYVLPNIFWLVNLKVWSKGTTR